MLVDLLLIGLAAWRLYRLVALDTGPKCILRRFRVWIGVRYTTQWSEWETDEGSFAEMFTCSKCFPVYAGLVLTLTWLFAPREVFLVIAVPLSVSTFVLVFENLFYAKLEG
jgi:hypothetical protein